MAFRFVHTADLHLDSPLKSLSLRNPDLAALIGDATRQALIGIVDLCLEEQVDALMIAGDLYDGDQTSMKTARFLAAQMGRLHEAGIRTFKIRGNHDALSRITQELVLPPSVKVFGGRAEAVEIGAGGLTLAIHGLSFSKPHAPESLLGKYRPAVAGAVNIGLMHTSLDGAAGHDPYAPCALPDLNRTGFAYWGLGHIHQRRAHAGASTVIMPGMPQGRDINEAGPKTVSLVTVADDGRVTVEERLTSLAEFSRATVDITAARDWRHLADLVASGLEEARAATRSRHAVVRLKLTGQSDLSFALRRDADLFLAEMEHRAEGLGQTWIDRIELAVERLDAATADRADPVVELGALMRDEVVARPAFRDDIREMVRDLLDDLPAESRRFAGETEEAFEAFLDRLLEESGEDVLARLKSSAGEAA
ncbi:metallophosphoesterase family protein [Gellertiella hungarica]|uniref:DNA repair exonuclease SbcCD nuclease subunit n=1 Tax=Gellertiella hungarica TaxID=1572859 RepID=A0A7W6J1V5_9HYPH|nr:DNA repair exonuclease [Gellertiella hungarica]MBB4063259.1 DNA repair exonuclease SbcCD nuclease subunit [Gellertiella hungarica]